MGRQGVAPLLVLGAGSLWGIIGLFSRSLGDAGFGAVQITAVRAVVTALGMVLFLFLYDRRLLYIRWQDIGYFLATGLGSIVFFNICYFTTIARSTLSLAVILLYTAPSFVMVLSLFFFGEALTRRKLLALALSFTGCVLVSGILGGVGAVAPQTFLIGLGAGIGYGLYSIFGKFALAKYHPYTVTLYTFVVASCGLLPFCGGQDFVHLLQQSPRVLPVMLAIGVLCTLLPFLLYTNALVELEAGKASVLAFAEPLVATVVGITIFHEAFGWSNGLGIGLIFVAILLLSRQDASLPQNH